MVYDNTLSESQMVVIWELIIKLFGTNIQIIYVVDNIVLGMLRILTSKANDQYNPNIRGVQVCAKILFATRQVNRHECGLPLDLYLLQRGQNKYPRKINFSTYMQDQRYD